MRHPFRLSVVGVLAATLGFGLSACVPTGLAPEDEEGIPAQEGLAEDIEVTGDDGKADGPACGDGVCYDRCDFGANPTGGCGDGFHCERRSVGGATAEVCIEGDWNKGLLLSDDGAQVLGLDPDGGAAEPYRTLAGMKCGGSFGRIDKNLFSGLGRTLLAMGSAGRSLTWERLCSRPSGLPSNHDIGDEASAGRAFRLKGSRTSLIAWVGYALYGVAKTSEAGRRGPLWRSRVMVYANSSSGVYYLYADGAADHPGYEPERGRHFGVVGGVEWKPLDTAASPVDDFRAYKAQTAASFTQQWADARTINWLAGMLRAHREAHGIPLGIGDCSLPTGGDIEGHGSHETGRDCDGYLLTFSEGATGSATNWISDCSHPSSGWQCWYTNQDTGGRESGAEPAGTRLKTLAQYALDHDGISHFVQNDVTVLSPFRARSGGSPRFLDESNCASSGWPLHQNHLHFRFAW
jgi:hypothetical protein